MNIIQIVYLVVIPIYSQNTTNVSSDITSTDEMKSINSIESARYIILSIVGFCAFILIIFLANKYHQKFLIEQDQINSSLLNAQKIEIDPQNKEQERFYFFEQTKTDLELEPVVDMKPVLKFTDSNQKLITYKYGDDTQYMNTDEKIEEIDENEEEHKYQMGDDKIVELTPINTDITANDNNTKTTKAPDDNSDINEKQMIDDALDLDAVMKKNDDLTDNQMNALDKQKSVSAKMSFRIQVEQLPKFDDKKQPWIIKKDRSPVSNASGTPTIKADNLMKQFSDFNRNRRVTLTNSHNFLWFTSMIQGSRKLMEQESEITRAALDKILNLMPIPFRNKIWEICNIDADIYLFQEDYGEFVDALLVATGQYDIDDDDDELSFEFRDMSDIFYQIIDIQQIFKNKKWTSNMVSKTKLCLSSDGATEIVVRLRDLDNASEIPADDIAIPLLTGFTRKAIKHSVTVSTRIFWKILTNIWWDEDDDDDMALPVELHKYKSIKSRTRNSKKRNSIKVSDKVKKHINSTSMDDLFPNIRDMFVDTSDQTDNDNSDDDDDDQLGQLQNNHLRV